jgi:hypothetical protein
MAGDKYRRTASALLAAGPPGGQHEGEALAGAAPAWVARVGRKGHVFFVGRHRHLVALTDQRLVAWRHPRRAMKRAGAQPTIDVPLAAVRLRAEHPAKVFFQVLATGASGDESRRDAKTTLVIELRHRDHAFARALGRALSATSAPATSSAASAPSAT